MEIGTERRTSRRNLLVAGAGALGGLVLSALGRPPAVRAVPNGNVQLAAGVGDSDNDAAAETRVNATGTGVAFSAVQTHGGTGLYGYSDTGGSGLLGIGGSSSAGLLAQSVTGPGASATSLSASGLTGASTDVAPPNPDVTVSTHRTGVFAVSGDPGTEGATGGTAANTDAAGVYGFSDNGPNAAGVWGDSWQGTGVFGSGDFGVSGIGAVAGVYASAFVPSAYALYTNGKIRFNGRSGRAAITRGHVYKDVAIPGMTSGSAVIATLQTNRAGYSVQAVVSYTGKFRLFLSRKATSTMYFSYLVIG